MKTISIATCSECPYQRTASIRFKDIEYDTQRSFCMKNKIFDITESVHGMKVSGDCPLPDKE